MEEIDPGFVKRVKPGDIIVAGSNFGCGSARDHAPFAIKGAGIACVIAESFARIFFRNALSIGLPVLECEKAPSEIEAGDELEVDLAKGKIWNLTSGKTYQANPFPDFLMGLIAAGGIIEYTRKKLGVK